MRACLVLLLAALAGCGGGGGNGAPEEQAGESEAAFRGPYRYTELTARGENERAQAGASEVDATGVLTGSAAFYTPGFGLAPPEPLTPLQSLLNAATGALRLRVPGTGQTQYTGGLSRDAELAALVRSDELLALRMHLRPAAGSATADVAGLYHFVDYTPSRGGSSTFGRMSFDGAGSGDVLGLARKNVAGTGFPSELEGSSVVVAPAGALILDLLFQGNARTTYEGSTGRGGRRILAMRVDEIAPVEPRVFAAVRAPTAANAASLAGTWRILLWFNAGEVGGAQTFATFDGTLVADGAGGATLDGRLRDDGPLDQIIGNLVGTYGVETDGGLTLTFPELHLTGGLDEVGDVAVLGGQPTNGLPPTFGWLLRLP